MTNKPISLVFNEDCEIGLKRYPDNFFDLAICDPPYGLGYDKDAKRKSGYQGANQKGKRKDYISSDWDNTPPQYEYFLELFRVSKNQIVWGANHFIDLMPYRSPCWIVWDKENGLNDFADCELAWASFKSAVRKYRFKWHGMLQEDMKVKEERIHPTQKPVRLYEWLLKNYANQGDKILDTHLGSQSSRIAAYKMSFDFYGWEIDKDYFKQGNERFNKSIEMPLFDNIIETKQLELI
jgi:site-specific DNA-methyltransferase (adenine-specific)